MNQIKWNYAGMLALFHFSICYVNQISRTNTLVGLTTTFLLLIGVMKFKFFLSDVIILDYSLFLDLHINLLL